jgi:hypothetical protein
MPADALDGFATRLEAMATAVGGEGLKAALTEVGMAAKEDVESAVRGDLGDTSMSNWRRGSPFEIAGRFDVSGSTVTVLPTPRSRGPWRVLEDGRSGGASTDLVLVGRTRKNGTRRAKSRGRNQGRTRGKNTWTDAERLIEKKFPDRALDALMAQLMKRW